MRAAGGSDIRSLDADDGSAKIPLDSAGAVMPYDGGVRDGSWLGGAFPARLITRTHNRGVRSPARQRTSATGRPSRTALSPTAVAAPNGKRREGPGSAPAGVMPRSPDQIRRGRSSPLPGDNRRTTLRGPGRVPQSREQCRCASRAEASRRPAMRVSFAGQIRRADPRGRGAFPFAFRQWSGALRAVESSQLAIGREHEVLDEAHDGSGLGLGGEADLVAQCVHQGGSPATKR